MGNIGTLEALQIRLDDKLTHSKSTHKLPPSKAVLKDLGYYTVHRHVLIE